MGLQTESNEQYYIGTKTFVFDFSVTGSSGYDFSDFNVDLKLATENTTQAPYPGDGSWNPTSPYHHLNNFVLETSPSGPGVGAVWTEWDGVASSTASGPTGVGGPFKIENNRLYFTSNLSTPLNNPLTTGYHFRVRLKNLNYGSYAYVSLNDVIDNFLVAYVGKDKLIPSVQRTDVLFHAKRGLQEFSYDTLRSVKSQELTIPPSLSVIIPPDYVNYVKVSWVDKSGVTHIIYPTRLTTNPYESPVQDSEGIPMQGSELQTDYSLSGNNIDGTSITEERWGEAPDPNLSLLELENYYGNMWPYWSRFYGQRYGLNPETAQINGWFTINDKEGKFSFSSNLVGKLIILEYISDGLAVDGDTKIPKLAEEAIYMHITYSILSTRARQPEYVVQRYKKERRAALRNAKIRLQNIKLEEITQVMRGKSKQIK